MDTDGPEPSRSGDDVWVQRLREALGESHFDAPAARRSTAEPGDSDRRGPGAVDETTTNDPDAHSQGVVVRTSTSADVLCAVRDLEVRLAEVEKLLRRLTQPGQLEGAADLVADAVVAKLDARWLGRLTDDDDATI